MRTTVRMMSDKKIALLIAGISAAAILVGVAAAFAVKILWKGPSGSESSIGLSESSSSISKTDTLSSQIPETEVDVADNDRDTVIYESDDGTSFSVPDTMRAVYLKPGNDFLLSNSDSEAKIKTQIDNAMQSIVKLGFNSAVVFTETSGGVIYTDSVIPSVKKDFDILAYVIESAKKHNVYSYVVYPALRTWQDGKIAQPVSFSSAVKKEAAARAAAFSGRYHPSAIVFDGYTVKKSTSLEAEYVSLKSKGTYEDYLRSKVTELVREAKNAARRNNKTSQIGFLASGVWANYSTDKNGSKTSSDYESYIDGFADTRDFVLNEKFNFAMIENMMPTDSVKNNFKTIASWWSTLCIQADIPFYNVHASSKLMTELGEFASPDQLILQVSELKKLKTYCGSVFDSLSALILDSDGSTTLLLKFFDNQIKDSLIFSKLKMSSPTSNTVTTYDSRISFSGASDPNFKLTFNGESLEVTEKGYFSHDAELKVGVNTFKISHKGKTVTYTVTRKIKLLDSVSPEGTIEVDGGTNIILSAMAYSGSKVSAKIGAVTVPLSEVAAEQASDGDQIESLYVRYEGVFKAPAASETAKSLGTVVYSVSRDGYSETKNGASINVFALPKKPVGDSADAVMIKEKFAETFPTDRLDDQSQPYCYPLPAGTVDYIVGNELTFKNSSGTYKYYKLMSGHRVYSKDVTSLGKIEKKTNQISSVRLSYDGRYANLLVDNAWSVPFKYSETPVSYAKDGVTVSGNYKVEKITYRIFYTDGVDTEKVVLDENPLVKNIECQIKTVTVDSVQIPVCDIVLTLKTPGGFFGQTPYYTNDNKTLDIRLNVSAPVQKANNAYGYTLNGAKIIIDAGHNSTSPGASGVLMDSETGKVKYPEYIMNEAIRDKVSAILKSLGATVITIDNEKMPYAAQRLEYFQSVNPHLMICIHHNSSDSSASRGPVGIYFNAYSEQLAKNIMQSVAGNYINNASNRAETYYFDRLKMTREPYYPSMLIECGFISNPEEQEQLILPENQQKIAQQIVKGMINYFTATGSLNHANLTSSAHESSGGSDSASQTPSALISPEPLPANSLEQSGVSQTLAYVTKRRELTAL